MPTNKKVLKKAPKKALLTIEEDSWETTLFDTSLGLELLKQVIILLGPLSLEYSFKDEDATAEFNAYDNKISSNAICQSLISQLVDKDVVQLIKDLLQNTKKNNKKIDFEREFSGNYGTLIKVLLFVFRANYVDLFNSNIEIILLFLQNIENELQWK